MSSGSIIAPGLLVLLAIVLGWVVLFAAMITVLRRRHHGPAVCAQCGYAVAGLDGLRCPECGSDLREVGVLAQGMHRGVPPFVAGLVWAVAYTALLPIPAVVTGALVRNAIPATYVTNARTTLSLGPGTGLKSVDLTWTGSGPNSSYDTVEFVAVDRNGAASPPLVVDLAGPVVTTETVESWLAAFGVTSGEIAPTLVRIGSASRPGGVSVKGPAFTGASTTSSQQVSRPVWPERVLPIAWGVVWVVGVILILARSGRRG